ncbi:helix-turn-helix domain-containing protein, partial [Escherichia coli]
PPPPPPPPPPPLYHQKTAYEILRCLVGSEMCIRDRVTGGRIQEMSALLGIGRTTLWRKMKQHGIDAGQFKRRG